MPEARCETPAAEPQSLKDCYLRVAMGKSTADMDYVAREICDMLTGKRVESVIGWPEKLFARVNGILPRVVDGALRNSCR